MAPIVVESILSRKLGITFIDARSIVTKAKLNLGLFGYPSIEERSCLIDESLRIYDEEYSGMQRFEMINNRDSLDRAIRRQSMDSSTMNSTPTTSTMADAMSTSSSPPSSMRESGSRHQRRRRRRSTGGGSSSTSSTSTAHLSLSPRGSKPYRKQRRGSMGRKRQILFNGNV